MNKNYQKMMKHDKKMKKTRHSPFLIVSEAAQFFINCLSFFYHVFIIFQGNRGK